MKVGLFLVVVVMLVAVLPALSACTARAVVAQSETAEPVTTPPAQQMGQIQCDGRRTWITTSQVALQKYLRANLDEGYQLTIEGQVFLVKCGTAVRVINRAQDAVQVQILEGEYVGSFGWTTVEFLRVP